MIVLARLAVIDSRATTVRLPPGLVSFHYFRPTDWRQRILQPTAAATVTDPSQRGDPGHRLVPVESHHLVAFQPRLIAHVPAVGRRPPAPRQVPLAPPGLKLPSRGRGRQTDPGRVGQRYPVPRTVLSGVLNVELTRRRARNRAPRGCQHAHNGDHESPI